MRKKKNENLALAMLGKQNALKGDDIRNDTLQVRCIDTDKDRWKKEAKELSLNLSDYVNGVMNGEIS